MNAHNRTQIVLNDVHIPFQNTVAVNMVVKFIQEQRPGTIHLLGDCCDLWSISRFDKDPTRRLNLQEELDAVRDWLHELRDAAPRARIIYSEGNHEYRLRKYLISEAKALAGLRALTLEKLLDFDSLKIRFQPHDRPYRIGHLLFTHGQFVSRWSAMSAKRHFERYGCCTIHGHTHRLGAFYHTDLHETYGCFENGCLSTLKPDYITAPDWQNGFSTIHFSKNFFQVEQIAIIHNRFSYRGRIYGTTRSCPSNVIEDLS